MNVLPAWFHRKCFLDDPFFFFDCFFFFLFGFITNFQFCHFWFKSRHLSHLYALYLTLLKWDPILWDFFSLFFRCYTYKMAKEYPCRMLAHVMTPKYIHKKNKYDWLPSTDHQLMKFHICERDWICIFAIDRPSSFVNRSWFFFCWIAEICSINQICKNHWIWFSE